jgi:hypothetical protein
MNNERFVLADTKAKDDQQKVLEAVPIQKFNRFVRILDSFNSS